MNMDRMSEKGTEYVFTLPDGSERYEICFERREVFGFQKMHGAVSARPLNSNRAHGEGVEG